MASSTSEKTTALGHLRMLDVTDGKGTYCAKLFADMGADVIKIEPPGGHPTRNIGPFVDDIPHPERSLHWFHHNTNKRSITLNLEHPTGREIFKALAKRVDVVMESFQPGYLERLGLGYPQLKALNPRIIVTSITGFGQTGPHRDYQTSDIVGFAMSGYMYTNGDTATPPLRAPFNQAFHLACYYAAIGTMCAIYHRRLSGRGQHVDASMQECTAPTVEHANLYWIHDRIVSRRRHNEHVHGATFWHLFRCQDGWAWLNMGLPVPWRRTVEWVESEGMAEDLNDPQWLNRDYRVAHKDHLYEVLERWTMTHTRDELFHGFQQRHVSSSKVNDVAEVVADPHLNERGFFVPVEHPELERTVTYLGAPYLFHQSPWRIARRAPSIGEHNLEIYEGELGFSRQELIVLAQSGAI